MGADRMRVLAFDEAVAQYERMPVPLRPATLHPAYVMADAARNRLLQPFFLSYEAGGECWLHSLHRTDVPGMPLKDASSPYGYGGPLCSTDDPAFLAAAWQAYLELMRADAVVVEYIRFHPMLGNERHYGGNVVESRAIVCVNLEQEDIMAGYAVRQRQALKKAVGAGLVYEEAGLVAMVREFAAFYRAGMSDIGADPFYLFADSYFEALAATGLARVGYCRPPEGQWLAAALFLDGDGIREYHLAATCAQGRRESASSFVVHHGGLAARACGLRRLYLGGGSDARPDNPLLFFKSAFSPQRFTYRTGWKVFDDGRYDELKKQFPRERTAHPERPIFHRIV